MLEISIDTIIFSLLNQTANITSPVYKAPINGLYRITVYGMIHGSDQTLGQAAVNFFVSPDHSFGQNSPVGTLSLQIQSQTLDSATSMTGIVALKAGETISVAMVYTSKTLAIPFDVYVIAEPLQAV